MVNVQINNEKAAALKDITDSVRDLLSLKITLPLGNPNLKHVHTNQFLWTDLPEEFELANFEEISKALNSSDARWSGYVKNRWYIEAVTITNDGSKFEMELSVNPFASSVTRFRDERNSFRKAYNDAEKQEQQQAKQQSQQQSSTKTVKSVTKKKKTIDESIKEVGKLMEKKKYKRKTYSDYKNFVKYGYGDCWAGSYYIACQLKQRGVTSRIIEYATSLSSHHRSVQYKGDDGKWHDFPYRKFKIDSRFRNTKSSGKVIKIKCS